MSGKRAIKEYAELCLVHDRQPNEAEYLAMVMFNILPKWIEELL